MAGHGDPGNAISAFIPGEYLNGIHTVDFLIWLYNGYCDIHAKNFTHPGGLLSIDIQVGGAKAYGSFDLFDEDPELLTEGIPDEALESAWGIEPNTSDNITDRFEKGKILKLGATGDWYSNKGDINAFQAKFSIEEN